MREGCINQKMLETTDTQRSVKNAGPNEQDSVKPQTTPRCAMRGSPKQWKGTGKAQKISDEKRKGSPDKFKPKQKRKRSKATTGRSNQITTWRTKTGQAEGAEGENGHKRQEGEN